jgi:thioredoxin-dependent peroxiredoxin
MSALEKYQVKVFAASTDKLEDNTKFAEQNKYNFPILSDPEKKVAQAYGVLRPNGFANRWTFLIDKQGIIRKIDTMVKPGEHGKDVEKMLVEMGVPKK